ncbi:DUF4064 domain-containing protein [Listeria booriae]|uniref:DUF4064 domain-containing protein n=1 Tax=Listeria booriae TaxID=1552123 RepID=A0A7X1CBT6_9LIST|nr:DUF4064 domain-containing protein [Listeria booriae]MBC1292093.1 DUF4064 domain-containing protein [Listeria booriae]MBC1491733.1 DUF4064 domain-containing protein [Listeria booriae]MBC1503552.1 DUF4064 domain-containing protein [Listeria booriae]MBC1511668.1 DUF4064 domain-containing protein [Listeria booriae]MBC1529325.1 DUF4064 domain-containing protein [Listeria booriae]
MNRTAEFILGLIGGITGVIASCTALISGLVLTGIGAFDADPMFANYYGLGLLFASIVVFFIAVFGIVAACLLKRNPKVWGILLIIAGGIGFVLIQLLWIVPGVLLIISGIMCVSRKTSPYDDF